MRQRAELKETQPRPVPHASLRLYMWRAVKATRTRRWRFQGRSRRHFSHSSVPRSDRRPRSRSDSPPCRSELSPCTADIPGITRHRDGQGHHHSSSWSSSTSSTTTTTTRQLCVDIRKRRNFVWSFTECDKMPPFGHWGRKSRSHLQVTQLKTRIKT